MKTEHILVIRFSAMGDVAMTVPVIYSLAKAISSRKNHRVKPFLCSPVLRDLAPNVGLWRLTSRGNIRV